MVSTQSSYEANFFEFVSLSTAEGRVFYAYQGLENGNPNQPTETELSNGEALKRFKEFIAHAQPGDARYTYHYRRVLFECDWRCMALSFA